jgi:hypothetical protein
MKYLKSFEQLNEAKATKAAKKEIDFEKKFAKKLEEADKLIKQALEDDINAIETDSTWESTYVFKSISITKNKLKFTYEETYPKRKSKTDIIDLKKDAENNFDEAKYLFSWIKKCIKKGYREENKSLKKEAKAQEKDDNK